MNKHDFEDIPNSRIAYLIDEYVHSERDRAILKRKFIDGLTFEQLEYEFGISDRQIKNIVYKQGDRILLKL